MVSWCIPLCMHAVCSIMHLLRNLPDDRGMITMCYHFNAELHLCNCYQAKCLEAISENDWLHLNFDWFDWLKMTRNTSDLLGKPCHSFAVSGIA